MRTPPAVRRWQRSCARNNACTAWACSGVAVLPVPMAHTGSYATTIRAAVTVDVEHRVELARDHFFGLAAFALRQVSPTHTIGVMPAPAPPASCRDHGVGLAVVQAPLGMPDDRIAHPKSAASRRRPRRCRRPKRAADTSCAPSCTGGRTRPAPAPGRGGTHTATHTRSPPCPPARAQQCLVRGQAAVYLPVACDQGRSYRFLTYQVSTILPTCCSIPSARAPSRPLAGRESAVDDRVNAAGSMSGHTSCEGLRRRQP